MSSAWAVVVAALGAALLTSLGSLGVVGYQERKRSQASDRDALHSAVLELLTRSTAVGLRAQALQDTIRSRSGLGEGVDVMLRYRKPFDPMELHDWQAQDLVPLNAALNEVWTRGDREGIRLADGLVSRCADLLRESTARAPARTALKWLRKAVFGERWTPGMLATQQCALDDMLAARRRLADYARAVLKMDTVDLFAQVEAPGGQPELAAGTNPPATTGG
jgi:hypothetical protein